MFFGLSLNNKYILYTDIAQKFLTVAQLFSYQLKLCLCLSVINAIFDRCDLFTDDDKDNFCLATDDHVGTSFKNIGNGL